MRSGKRRFAITLAAAALLLAGCAQFERKQPIAADDGDAYCRANAAAGPGSPAFAACLKDRQAANTQSSETRIERAHRNLAEDMLNNRR